MEKVDQKIKVNVYVHVYYLSSLWSVCLQIIFRITISNLRREREREGGRERGGREGEREGGRERGRVTEYKKLLITVKQKILDLLATAISILTSLLVCCECCLPLFPAQLLLLSSSMRWVGLLRPFNDFLNSNIKPSETTHARKTHLDSPALSVSISSSLLAINL